MARFPSNVDSLAASLGARQQAGAKGGTSIGEKFKALSGASNELKTSFDGLGKSSQALTQQFSALAGATSRSLSSSFANLSAGSNGTVASLAQLAKTVITTNPELLGFNRNLEAANAGLTDTSAAIITLPGSLNKFDLAIGQAQRSLSELGGGSGIGKALALLGALGSAAVAFRQIEEPLAKARGALEAIGAGAGGGAKAAGSAALGQLPGILKSLVRSQFSEPGLAVSSAKIAAGNLIGGDFGGRLAAGGRSAAAGILARQAALKGADALGGAGGRLIRGGVAAADLAGVLGSSGAENIGAGYLRGGRAGKAQIALGAGQAAFNATLGGGAAGAAAGGGNALLGGIGSVVGGEFSKLTGFLDRAGNATQGLNKSITPLAGVFGSLGKATATLGNPISALLGPIGALGAAFTALPGLLEETLSGITKFVAAGNPALVQQLQLVMGDLMAVIGNGLAPIITGITPIIRQVADMFARIAPAIQALSKATIDLATPLMSLLEPAFAVLVPIISTLTNALGSLKPVIAILVKIQGAVYTVLAPALTLVGTLLASLEPVLAVLEFILDHFADALVFVANAAAKGIGVLIQALNELAGSWVGRRLGLKAVQTLDQFGEQSSVGAKVQEIGYGSIEDFARKTTIDALKASAGANGLTPDGNAITDWLKRVVKAIQDGKSPWGQDLDKDGEGSGGSWD